MRSWVGRYSALCRKTLNNIVLQCNYKNANDFIKAWLKQIRTMAARLELSRHAPPILVSWQRRDAGDADLESLNEAVKLLEDLDALSWAHHGNFQSIRYNYFAIRPWQKFVNAPVYIRDTSELGLKPSSEKSLIMHMTNTVTIKIHKDPIRVILHKDNDCDGRIMVVVFTYYKWS